MQTTPVMSDKSLTWSRHHGWPQLVCHRCGQQGVSEPQSGLGAAEEQTHGPAWPRQHLSLLCKALGSLSPSLHCQEKIQPSLTLRCHGTPVMTDSEVCRHFPLPWKGRGVPLGAAVLDVSAKFRVTVPAWMYHAKLQGCWLENKSKIDRPGMEY